LSAQKSVNEDEILSLYRMDNGLCEFFFFSLLQSYRHWRD